MFNLNNIKFQSLGYLDTFVINFFAIFLKVLVFIHSYMRMFYRFQLISFRESFTYPKDINLIFFGCEPIIWIEGNNNRISGLPKKVTKDVVGFENICDMKITSFTPEDGMIPWKQIFEDLSKITFYEDLE